MSCSSIPCPAGLKEYEILAGATLAADGTTQGSFTVNGEAVPLLAAGGTYTLSTGAVLGLDEALIQNYAGGLHGLRFELICS